MSNDADTHQGVSTGLRPCVEKTAEPVFRAAVEACASHNARDAIGGFSIGSKASLLFSTTITTTNSHSVNRKLSFRVHQGECRGHFPAFSSQGRTGPGSYRTGFAIRAMECGNALLHDPNRIIGRRETADCRSQDTTSWCHPAFRTKGKPRAPAGGIMNTSIRKFLAEEDGITALEYGLLAAIVAAIIVVAFKTPLTDFFGRIFKALDNSTTKAIT